MKVVMDDENPAWFISHPILHLVHHSSLCLALDLQSQLYGQLFSILWKEVEQNKSIIK
jgi:hypothetical protein